MRVFSFGGGVQCTAVLALTAQGQLAYDAFLFAHVGPDILADPAEQAAPYAAAHGIPLHILRRRRRNRTCDTLLAYKECATRPDYLHLSRRDCVRIVEKAGLLIPPKSACWLCPFHTPRDWQALRRDHPDLFHAAGDLETLLNARRATLGRDPAYLHAQRRPLAEATAMEQLDLPDPMACESGHCMT